jgi:short-subunit dehydrogenase
MKRKVIIITGASSGIGRALAFKFASEGSSVVVAARRLERLKSIEKEFGSDRVLVVETDVSREDDCKNLIEKTIEKFGTIDVLINNAGVSMRAMFSNCDTSVLKRLMDVNFWGTVYCTKYALPYLIKSGGSLVGIVSVAGYFGLPGRTGYSASKFAIRGFLESLRVEFYKSRLNVLIVAPGFVNSEIRECALTSVGLPQGKSPRNEKNMMSNGRCASFIYKAVKRRKRELILSFFEGKLAVFISKWCPQLVDRANYIILKGEPDCPF